MSTKTTVYDVLQNQKSLKFIIPAALLLFVWVGYILYINFSYYWDFLHSDIVADLAFIREAARTFSLFPEGWAHINEMRFIYVTTPAILFYWITGNVHLSYSLAVAFMLLVNLALFYYMISFKKRHLLAVLLGMIVLLMVFSRYSVFSLFSILFINGTLSTHLATVFLTVGFYLRLKYKETGSYKLEKTLWIITLILAFAQGIQSSRMMVVLYAPLVFMELLQLLRCFKKREGQLNIIGLIYAFSALALNMIGMMFINSLIENGAVVLETAGLTFGLNLVQTSNFIDRILEALVTLINALGLSGGVELFSAEGLTFILRAGFIFIVVFLYHNIKKDEEDKHFVGLMLATVVFSLLSQSLITIGMGERFNFTVTSFIAVIFVITFSQMMRISESVSLKQANMKFQAWISEGVEQQLLHKGVTIFLAVMVLGGSLFSFNTLGANRNPGLVDDRQAIVNFLKSQNLTVGYGAFWQSHAITGVADWEVVVIPFHANRSVVGQPLRQGVAYHDFFHQEQRVFLVGTFAHMEEAYGHERMGEVLTHGVRHDFPGGWVVYIFDFNPWAHFKQR